MSTASITHAHEEDAPTPIRAAETPCEHVFPTDDVAYDDDAMEYVWVCTKCGERFTSKHLVHPEQYFNDKHVYPPESEDDPLVKITHPVPAHPAPPPSHPLTTTERAAFVGLQARHRELVQMFNDEERAILGEVEARLGLAPGSIGVSHNIDGATWAVVAQPATDDGQAHPA